MWGWEADMDYGFTRINASLEVPVVAVTPDGEAASGRTLMYRIFHNENYWWWEYDSRDQFRLRFKRDFSTKKIFETSIISQERPVPVAFTPEKQGEYLIEVADADGHRAALFIRAYPWQFARKWARCRRTNAQDRPRKLRAG